MVSVSAIFIAAAAVWLVGLSVLTMLMRRKLKISIGTAGNPTMERFMRAQANAAEYLPMMGLLMVAMELQGAPHWLLMGLGGTMLLGRLSHGYGLLVAEPKFKDFKFRVFGMVCTWGCLGVGALVALGMTL